MMPLIPLIALLVFIFSLISLLSKTNTKNPKYNLPPGPRRLPLIGNLNLLDDLIHHSLHKLSLQYGPLVYRKLGSIPTVVASSADLAREFLKTHDLDCCSRPPLISVRKLSYGFRDIVFSPYDQQWRELRKVSILHLFNTKKVASLRWVREEEVGRMMTNISSRMDTYHVVDLSEEMMAVANTITCVSALGKRYEDGEGKLLEILRETQALFMAFFWGDYVPMMGWVDVVKGMRRRLEKNFEEMDMFYQEVIEERRDTRRRKRERMEDAVDALLDMQLRDTSVTDDHIKGVLMVYLFTFMLILS